ncbi:MAG: D-lysine 5,6-aminomutase subunit alpha [Spirochaetes bacterium GWD1_61_31]|nr:MAG: D-lysine 5,6-aminomutase subunit alpha [Spirochaetes bacterium GWB1_60_80]OHD29042.1 MAG: D-lysine 5,6-aminomutase subunit alpha [Spirochaetes bacterium GWC1_61_12]OHD35595.1 MAG: D-lysine 5,6-aminomutase subunit alpha [Spirochaetes bacterium GWD1_61_31]OHD44208.1 MAG: D-lysine 5,6-aminomutase subunit alpha [Spirochaetes bacterium GWE1_60_18]OHD60432.1 MAG: D-lysine 5,6-aminomutase subunit alpha [Spirochaetes bacterium GWF1_60_12]HAP44464.1 D-lysine 5,6-aminomutase subunit alpha [Spiro
MRTKLDLPADRVRHARTLAGRIAQPVQSFIDGHSSVTVERATLRLTGADGANADGVPVPNLVVDQIKAADPLFLEDGVLLRYVNALVRNGDTVEALNAKIAAGFNVASLPLGDRATIEKKAAELVQAGMARIKANRQRRGVKQEQFKGQNNSPLLYLIVATGNIYEDVKQAQAAVVQGADVIAVIRTTAQSLLDYVPFGATTEGFGGTYATQENFRIMRAALDEAGDKAGRYILLTNYASGLCMPEIAAMGALERLDMMLNDSMYGILFRDINMYRTFVDQKFSRMINAYAGIIINTGEDNYLTTSDAFEKAYTVLASQFLNEEFGFRAGLPAKLLGLGHAFEMDPTIKNGFLYEFAQAQMAREIFPEHPLKYMPPTKFMTGDVFKGLAMNTLFNFVSKATGQGIHLLGMLTEAVHTPFMMDRYLAVDNARYVMNNIQDFADDIEFRQDGIMVTRAHQVLKETIDFMEAVDKTGLFEAIAAGMFAEVKRPKDGGKGLEGLIKKGPHYFNPFEKQLAAELGLGGAQ